jgi:hypothetical protein
MTPPFSNTLIVSSGLFALTGTFAVVATRIDWIGLLIKYSDKDPNNLKHPTVVSYNDKGERIETTRFTGFSELGSACRAWREAIAEMEEKVKTHNQSNGSPINISDLHINRTIWSSS